MTTSSAASPDRDAAVRAYDAVIIGAGLAGIGMLRRLRDDGFSAVVLEAGGGVGGTWYWNRYPGACCDSASEVYSYSFSDELLQSWSWQTRYPTQPQVLSYLEHVTERFDLNRHIEFNQRVASATYDDGGWRVTTESGDVFAARYCITAVGCLSEPLTPSLEGLADFGGEVYSTARWPHEQVDLAGKRVAVIGTGSSGIQIIPAIAGDVAQLTVFQRTANYAIPARNRPLAPEAEAKIKANYPAIREEARWTPTGNLYRPDDASALEVGQEERRRRYQQDWDEGGFQLLFGGYHDLGMDEEANRTVADFVREKIGSVIEDPQTRAKLVPRDHPIGTKRPPLDEGYFEVFNRQNVTLVDLKAEPIARVTEHGIATSSAEYPLDVIIFATGFDAVTGALNKIDITGADGRKLKDVWQDGPRTYLGIATAGFPNLFMITGPQSPSVMGTVTISIEQHIEWLGDLLDYARDHRIELIEATEAAQDAWVQHVQDLISGTLLAKYTSWYLGSNVPGKTRTILTYAGGVGTYRARADEVRDAGYDGFTLTPGHERAGAGGAR
ncbi:MAG TPA: NAD(P)/FAD-dependent oxidoreductase [Trebonia sp.]|jgi:cyclohexanone monooxygenase|nr:NAD(P)/FAD-dependent oxidoreductase [Trebonia sp.]